MGQTKQMLAAFDLTQADPRPGEFVIPSCSEGGWLFQGLRSGTEYRYALTVFVGRLVTENDLFAKLIDTGAKIPTVAGTLGMFKQYLDVISKLKVGNVVQMRQPAQGAAERFNIELFATTPSAARAKSQE